MTVTRLTRNGYEVIECSACGDSSVLTGRPEWRDAEEDAWRFRHPESEHAAPSLQPKVKKGTKR